MERSSFPARLASGTIIPPHAGVFPATLAQEREFQLSGPDRVANINHKVELHVDGPLDVAIAQQASDAVVARHAALRTFLRPSAGSVLQIVLPAIDLPLEVLPLPVGPAATRRAHTDELIEQRFRTPFRLEQPPLLRAGVASIDDRDHRVFWIFAHTIMDATSLTFFRSDFVAFYEALANGRSPDRPPPPVELSDIASFERAQPDPAALAHWRRHLGGASPSTTVPVDRRRIARCGHEVTLAYGPPATSVLPTLGRLGREGGGSTGIAAVAAVASVLHGYADRDDVVLTVQHGGRDRPGTAEVFGRLADALPLALDFGGRPSFVERVDRVATAIRGRTSHRLAGGTLLGLLSRPPELALNVVRYELPPPDSIIDGFGEVIVFDERDRTLAANFDTGNGEWYGAEIVVTLALRGDDSVRTEVRYNAHGVTHEAGQALADDVAEMFRALPGE